MEGRIHVDPSDYVDLAQEHLFKTSFRKQDNPVTFESKSEAVCAILMERHIGWQCKLGETYQVPLAFNKRADFLIRDKVLFEFHPISLHREFMSNEAKHVFTKHMRKLPDWLAGEFKEAIQMELYCQYRAKRALIMKATPGLEDAELIVATDARYVHKKVISRFSDNPPSLSQFTNEWNDTFKRLKK